MNIAIADPFSLNFKTKLEPYGIVQEKVNQSAEVVLVRSATKIDRSYMENLPDLKLIIRGGIGLDNIDTENAGKRGITVKNTPLASAVSVAELAFALLISIPSKLIDGHSSMAKGEWIKNRLKRTELCGKTICLIGMGSIATEMAKRCSAFGMKVKAYRKSGQPSEYAEVIAGFKEAVCDADFISLHVPLTDETRNMINRETISMMKEGAAIINTARGKCINSKDLYDALESGKISAYAADVWEKEPPDESCILCKAKNVIMTPHIGSSSKENSERIESEIIQIIEEYKKGVLK